MKTLVVYYSRTGITKKVAGIIAKDMKADIQEVHDLRNRKGIIGYILGGRDAVLKRLTPIKVDKKLPQKYGLVVIGTPIWAGMSPAIRTYIIGNKGTFKNVAFFCTMGGSGDKKAFKGMAELIGRRPLATLTLNAKDMKGDYHKKVADFVKRLK
ncbi:MAG: hypothetical protein WC471_04195 [Candidatus Woesearchaeota archaeon]